MISQSVMNETFVQICVLLIMIMELKDAALSKSSSSCSIMKAALGAESNWMTNTLTLK